MTLLFSSLSGPDSFAYRPFSPFALKSKREIAHQVATSRFSNLSQRYFTDKQAKAIE